MVLRLHKYSEVVIAVCQVGACLEALDDPVFLTPSISFALHFLCPKIVSRTMLICCLPSHMLLSEFGQNITLGKKNLATILINFSAILQVWVCWSRHKSVFIAHISDC